MKKRVSLLLKIVLSTLTVLLYAANLIDAVFYISPYPRKTSLTSMLLSVAFLASYLLLLFVLRRKKMFLYGSLVVSSFSVVCEIFILYAQFFHVDCSPFPLAAVFPAMFYFPFHGLSFFFPDRTAFIVAYAVAVVLLLFFKIFLFVKWKKERKYFNEKT